MTYSVTCIEQRQQEIKKTRKLLTIGVLGSIALHGIMFRVLNSVEKPIAEEKSKPIEFIVVQEPEIKPEKETPKPKEKPQPQPKLETVKPPLPQKREVQPQPKINKTETKPNPQPQKKVKDTPEPIRETTPQPTISESSPPQEVLTSDTVVKNNPLRTVKPINEDSNSLSSSLNSPTRVENSNNQSSTIARVTQDTPVSSGRLSRSSNNTPRAVSSSQGEEVVNLRNSLSRSSGQTSNNNSQNIVSAIPSNIAATSQSVPSRPQAKPTPPPPESIKCVSNCNPKYPSALQGVEGKTTVKVNLDSNGNVLGVSVVNPHSNGEVNRQALLAARKMRFSSPGVNNASVQVSINFTVAGSEFDRIARQKKEAAERQARLEQEKERQARQAQLEKERLERQRQLEKERQEREAQARIEREKREEELRKQQELEQNQQETLPSETPTKETNLEENDSDNPPLQ